MRRLWLAALVAGAVAAQAADSVTVELKNARRTVTYHGALVVDGKDIIIKNQQLSATEGNEIVALVVNGGHLVLDHCTIIKAGDGIRQGGGQQQMRPQRPDGDMQPRPEGDMQPRNEGGQQRRQRPGGGGGGGDDAFNFYGTNSAVVAVGRGSRIEMKACKVVTGAEYANAVFAADEAEITITKGIDIETKRGSSRGLFATTAGVITATGPVNISTAGAHCAALATDRGGGTVTVGKPGTKAKSVLNTAGEGSPCIYSTGDIFAYNCRGAALTSQTMVIEGKNSITIDQCALEGHSPKHGGVMLYQSTSGDASVGTSVLNMSNSTLRDNSATAMFLVTNTHSVVNMRACTLLGPDGDPVPEDYPLVTCRDCTGDGRNWGRSGSNGGQLDLNLDRQTLRGIVSARERDSQVRVTTGKDCDISQLREGDGLGDVEGLPSL